MNEKYRQHSAAISAPNCRIQILAFDIAAFDPENTWILMKKLLDLVGIDTMFSDQLLNDRVKPNDAKDFHDYNTLAITG
jgi:hypothetical protein